MADTRYPIGDPSFVRIREEGFFYVDKTEYIHRMVKEGVFYFLSRPRRFGKSLLVSTLEAYFQGKRELFKGLAIDDFEKEWKKYPVFRFDLSAGDMSRHGELESHLGITLGRWEDNYGANPAEDTVSSRFRGLIQRAVQQTGLRVVVLVDEYDNPLFSTIDDKETHERMRSTLKGIYSVLKAESDNIRFCFLTGITRFSKMSVFSGLNNLEDITLEPDYAGICGITQEELTQHCGEGIRKVAEMNSISYDGALAELKGHYDGYHFSAVSPDVYNPFSLIQAFKKGSLKSYWFTSGTSKFLWERICRLGDSTALLDVLSPTLTETQLGATEEDGLTLEALLYQSGYLTIKGTAQRGRAYRLGIPNREVEEGIMEGLLPLTSRRRTAEVNVDLMKMRDYADDGDVDAMMRHIRSFLAEIPYQMHGKNPEIYYENNLLILFTLIGIQTRVEMATADGRMDVAMRCENFIYVLELKLDKSADGALRQIREKDYQLPFERKGLPIILVGVNFSSEKRNIDSWVYEQQ